MSRKFNYECTQCHRQWPREQLTAKVVQFKEIGHSGRVLRSRVVDWLCGNCLNQDLAYLMVDREIIDTVALGR
jgi:hypothetical protein